MLHPSHPLFVGRDLLLSAWLVEFWNWFDLLNCWGWGWGWGWGPSSWFVFSVLCHSQGVCRL